MNRDEDLVLTGPELLLEHTGRTCDAPENPDNGLIRCDLPPGHGGWHLSRGHSWFDKEGQ